MFMFTSAAAPSDMPATKNSETKNMTLFLIRRDLLSAGDKHE
jgi:hypothetical protein